VTKEDMTQLFSVLSGPTFYRSLFQKKDIRVTGIGKSLFVVAIDPYGFEDAYVDLRSVEPYDLSHEPIELPKKVKNNCITMVRNFGLQFDAIDLLHTFNNDYFFLEINPNGQWLWLEDITGIPLLKTMCNLLQNEKD
jgi:hypothetical protein